MPQITIVLQYKIFIKNSAGAAEKFRRACAFNYTAPPRAVLLNYAVCLFMATLNLTRDIFFELVDNLFFKAGYVALRYAERVGDVLLGHLVAAVQAEAHLHNPLFALGELA